MEFIRIFVQALKEEMTVQDVENMFARPPESLTYAAFLVGIYGMIVVNVLHLGLYAVPLLIVAIAPAILLSNALTNCIGKFMHENDNAPQSIIAGIKMPFVIIGKAFIAALNERQRPKPLTGADLFAGQPGNDNRQAAEPAAENDDNRSVG